MERELHRRDYAEGTYVFGGRLKSGSRGFSLIELLIVVAIILIIAAISIPNLLRSRMAANQASAVESLRVLNTAETTYSSTYNIGYSTSLAQLGPAPAGSSASSAAADLIDVVLAGGEKSGYSFTYTPTLQTIGGAYNGYNLNANPTQSGLTGINYYFTDQTLVIRANSSNPATSADSAVAQ